MRQFDICSGLAYVFDSCMYIFSVYGSRCKLLIFFIVISILDLYCKNSFRPYANNFKTCLLVAQFDFESNRKIEHYIQFQKWTND